MKITSINNQNNFRGLWGESIKTQEHKNLGSKMINSDYETKIYYPFGDESIEDVNNIMKKNITYKRTIENYADTLSISQTGIDVSVKQRLLFSAKQCMKYMTNKLAIGSIEHRLIEQNLRSLHLEKYLHA